MLDATGDPGREGVTRDLTRSVSPLLVGSWHRHSGGFLELLDRYPLPRETTESTTWTMGSCL